MNLKYLCAAMICAISLFLSGCIERKEELTIDERGNVSIHTSFSGDIDQYPPVFDLPNGGAWKNIKSEFDKKGKKGLEASAEMNIPYGRNLPDRYDLNDHSNRGLRFPSTVKRYQKGARTFYEFTRRYQPRKYLPYEIYYETVDKELEEEVFKKGIFSVSPTQRDSYLRQLTPAFHSSQLRIIYDVLGIMVFQNDISQDARRQMLLSAGEKVRQAFPQNRLETTLARVNKSNEVGDEMDEITKEMDQIFISIFKNQIRPDRARLSVKFTQILENERRSRKITDAINEHIFNITLKMPGQIVVTNGIFSEESLGTVSWEFRGSALHDCEYVLHAVSVVEN
ncbi:MAG: hypothetical protein JXA73_20475 [Acidobacteria bacterium]|nr:hypothetical protein [Acidobacteriota bacterium]